VWIIAGKIERDQRKKNALTSDLLVSAFCFWQLGSEPCEERSPIGSGDTVGPGRDAMNTVCAGWNAAASKVYDVKPFASVRGMCSPRAGRIAQRKPHFRIFDGMFF